MPESSRDIAVAQAAPIRPYLGINKRLRATSIARVRIPVMELIFTFPAQR